LYNLIKPHHPDLHLSTVYRTLRWLEQEGLVGSQRLGEGSRQDRFDPGYPSEHHHFVCTNCQRVIEFQDFDCVKDREGAAGQQDLSLDDGEH
jgi:Fe2+ or Zn2+ uptake regulation protein